jgi:hypothetical protein
MASAFAVALIVFVLVMVKFRLSDHLHYLDRFQIPNL